MKILIATDSEAEFKRIKSAVRRCPIPCEYSRVDDWDAFSQALIDLAPQIILSDCKLAGFSGLQALELASLYCADVPFILIAAAREEQEAIKALAAGAVDYVLNGNLSRLIPCMQKALTAKLERTVRRTAEEALQRQEELLKTILENMPLMIDFIDATGKLRWANGAWERALGWTIEEVHRKDILPDLYPDPEIRQQVIEFITSAAGEWREFRLRTKSGRWLQARWVHVRLSDGSNIGLGEDITERTQAYEQLESGQEQLKILSRKLIHAQEQERRSIARELHDEIGQSLSGVKMILEATSRLPDARILVERLGECTEIVDHVLQKIRELSLDLRPSVLDDLSLTDALRWCVERQTRHVGMNVRLESTLPEDLDVLSDLKTVCFRITQEAFTNVLRHSGARNTVVQLRRRNGRLSLSIEDDGRGFDVPAALRKAVEGRSMGLLNMRERVLLAGGTIDIASAPGRGTRIEVTLPL